MHQICSFVTIDVIFLSFYQENMPSNHAALMKKSIFTWLYNIQYFCMGKTEGENLTHKSKSIKNVYIHKINSLMKIMGDSNTSLPCLNKVRKTISYENKEGWLRQKKENNKDAARKARLRKKLYMELLQQLIKNMQELNEESKQLETFSNQFLETLRNSKQCKQEDDIGQYLLESDGEKVKKDISQATMQSQKVNQLHQIVEEVEKVALPTEWTLQQLETLKQKPQNMMIMQKMRRILQQLPQIFIDLRNICSDHTSLYVVSSSKKNQVFVDPYFAKTLMQEYYSKTLCRKNVSGIEVEKFIDLLTRMEVHCIRSEQIDS